MSFNFIIFFVTLTIFSSKTMSFNKIAEYSLELVHLYNYKKNAMKKPDNNTVILS